ncbi:MAG: ethanolamine ammonia-lyase subunit EutB [Proteobacteria bacterium]|nr:ethanolamine ammonia-lyase subunit EutB [Pseudomonadota bacterium]NDC23010.1 ethanolamine ammonia-lyase subunit EutB [Pseudomonadota bacterium]NDD03672.1 ethanolamine ammonia-lyase subunit EutB [Pseudomonadota bacterium]NDG25792.1 ethanolamine ammonia-lyase subunit EutB [Pseudomonadota bacterium]
MAPYRATVSNKTFSFKNLGEVLAKATPERSGDILAKVAAQDAEERVAAQWCLADVPLKDFVTYPLIPYEEDEVTRLICDSWEKESFKDISHHTVGSFREFLLASSTTDELLLKISPGLLPEMVAAVSKLMRNQDLISVAQKAQVKTRFRSTVGKKGHLSIRLQPNHPTDDLKAITAAVLDGILYGCGDAVIGVNPATDSLERMMDLQKLLARIIEGLAIPTQSCVLGHVTHQIAAISKGSPVDLVFQSIGGTELTNKSFGIQTSLLKEAQEAALSLGRGGNQVMYFETGQGSCLSARGHHGLDQQTLEARAYGLARCFNPFLVNSVVGFIGPEYLYDGKQIIRAGLEDHFCGKMLRLPMGCDVCYTNHAQVDQDDMDSLLTLLGVAGCNYFMGVPGADDIMLNYQSTSFHDAAYLREVLQLRPAPEFEVWLKQVGIFDDSGKLSSLEPQVFRNVASTLLPKGNS